MADQPTKLYRVSMRITEVTEAYDKTDGRGYDKVHVASRERNVSEMGHENSNLATLLNLVNRTLIMVNIAELGDTTGLPSITQEKGPTP